MGDQSFGIIGRRVYPTTPIPCCLLKQASMATLLDSDLSLRKLTLLLPYGEIS